MTMTAMMMIMILMIDPRPPSSPLSDNLLLKVDRLLRDPAFETHFFSVSQLCNKILCSCFMLCYVIIFKKSFSIIKSKSTNTTTLILITRSGRLSNAES